MSEFTADVIFIATDPVSLCAAIADAQGESRRIPI